MSKEDILNTPWKDGFYRDKTQPLGGLKIEGETYTHNTSIACVNFDEGERPKVWYFLSLIHI